MEKAPKETWKSHGVYIENISPQRSEYWFSIRDTPPLISASNFAAAVGKSRFCSKDELLDIMRGKKKREFSEVAKKHMERGIIGEPLAMEQFSNKTGMKCWETGIKFSVEHPYFAASEDFETMDGEIVVGGEIKCPMRMPRFLLRSDMSAHKRIYSEHYAQMQGAMMITERPWHWYVVKSEIPTDDGIDFHMERVPRDEEYIKFLRNSLLDVVHEFAMEY